jgi:DNA-binding transcriptional LysR family regulator
VPGLLGHHLRAFQAAYPAIELELITGNALSDLPKREADVALRPAGIRARDGRPRARAGSGALARGRAAAPCPDLRGTARVFVETLARGLRRERALLEGGASA